MKKNKMMRLASSLLVAVLLTSSVISGTFAKYVTSDSAQDSARVAQFGVKITADGHLFENTYAEKTTDTGGVDKLTVKSSDKVVAPGTNNSDKAFTFSITGAPEVDVKVTVDFKINDDVFLAVGNYNNPTTDKVETTSVTKEYHPIKYTLKKDGAVVTDFDGLTATDFETKFETLFNKSYDSGTDLGAVIGTYEIAWEWEFGGASGTITLVDEYDTILGNLAANSTYDPAITSSMYSLNTDVELTILVEQID